MARFGDKGAYEPGNVQIITHKQNLQDANLGKQYRLGQKQSKAEKEKRRTANVKWLSKPENRRKLSEAVTKWWASRR